MVFGKKRRFGFREGGAAPPQKPFPSLSTRNPGRLFISRRGGSSVSCSFQNPPPLKSVSLLYSSGVTCRTPFCFDRLSDEYGGECSPPILRVVSVIEVIHFFSDSGGARQAQRMRLYRLVSCSRLSALGLRDFSGQGARPGGLAMRHGFVKIKFASP